MKLSKWEPCWVIDTLTPTHPSLEVAHFFSHCYFICVWKDRLKLKSPWQASETNTDGRSYSLPLAFCWESKARAPETNPKETAVLPWEDLMHLWEVSEEQSFEMLWQYLHVRITLQQSLLWVLLLQGSSALWALNFQFWLQRNRRKRKKGVEEINGISLIPSSSSRWKGQRLMDTVKLLSAWIMMFSWGNWSRSVTIGFFWHEQRYVCMNTVISAYETDEWGD